MIDLNDAVPPRAVQYDLDAIVARLRDSADAWVPQHFPNGRREGEDWRLANIRGAAPRKTGSCVIALKGARAGDWYDHDGGAGGGPLSTLEHATGLSGRELYAYAASLAGWSDTAPVRREPTPASSKERDSKWEIEIILSRSVPLAGTLGETYLRARGLGRPPSNDLLFHPDLTHWETKTGFPALVGVVRGGKPALDRDPGDEVTALQRIYLRLDGTSKADVPNSKKMVGKVAGGAVRLGDVGENGLLGIAEGIETALAVMTALPDLPVWAALSTGNLERVVLPSEATRVVILADHDVSGAGLRAAEAAAARLVMEGRRVFIALPPGEGEDFNDLLLRGGAEAVKAAVDAAREWTPPAAEAEPPSMGRHLPIGFTPPSPPLPILRSDEGDLTRASDRAWDLLHASNRTPWLFRAGGVPSWVVPDDEGRPMAAPLSEERLRYVLARLALWRRLGPKDQLLPASPPTGLVKTLLATPDPALPVLAGIVTAPVFGKGGALLTEPGYHGEARLLYHPVPGFVLPAVPERPSAGEIAAARGLIMDDLLGEFPFISEAERAHAVALLLLGFLRAMIDGPTPLHLIEKPSPGTGATLMVDAIATVLTGAGASVMTEGRDDEEWRKRLTAKLRQIPSLLLIDNLRRTLDSSALAAALTAPYWEDRILGVSEMTRLPIRCAWIATGNNPEFSNEMARRIVRIRLDARVDQPWRREGFRHPDLMGWVRANRERLVAACLTLIRAWIVAGRPMGAKVIGSFEAWARVTGGVLEVAGIAGFLENLDDLMAASDAEGAMWRSFVAAWWERFGTAEVATGDLYDLAIACEPPLPLGSGNDRSQRIRLGRALGKMRDRVFDIEGRKMRVRTLGVSHQAKRWQLALEGECGECASGAGAASGGECRGNVGNVASRHSPAQPIETKGSGECGECGECISAPYMCAGAHACARDEEMGDRHSPHSPHSQKDCFSEGYAGECVGEYGPLHSPQDDPPDWLKEVL